jgi:uncharacterized protein (TIGR03435 family)
VSFDAASIRPSDGPQRSQFETTPGSFIAQNESLRACLQWAYEVQRSQIIGPDFLGQTGFNITAKVAGTADEGQMRLLVKTLLAERFGVKAHTEQREMQIYLLTLAKGGPKFHESTTEGPPVFSRGGKGSLKAERVTMRDVAAQISDPLNRPVIDATGLKGRYDIDIDVTAYMTANGGRNEGELDVMSILFNALQQQLGVKLEARKDMVDVLVIDHAKKTPSDN